MVATSVRAQDTAASALVVLAKRDHSLAIIDPITLQVVGKAPAGDDPHEVVVSPDGRFAYISNYGGLGSSLHTLSVVDLVTRKALAPIDLGPLHSAHGLAYAGGKVYFTAETNKVIGTYDPASQKVDWVLGIGQNRTHMLGVAKDLKRIVTSNVNSATIAIVDQVARRPGPPPGGGPSGGWDWNVTTIPVGQGAEGFDLSPDETQIWVANAQDGTVSIIDVASKKVVATLNAHVNFANRLKFTLDGKNVLVSSLGNGELVEFDSAQRKQIKRIKVGHGAAGILMAPDGSRAFVACSPDNYVAVIDLKTFTVMGHISPGQEPDGMAWASRR